ncbi:hypothetical protein G786_02916 [Escherichia coli HVH 126 (4-6034225)]|nr:hypothetical protein G786_02916 [Escherichia coli HVH 126 (4-6034225)]
MALDSYASPNIIPELRQPNAAAGKITLGGLDRMAVDLPLYFQTSVIT